MATDKLIASLKNDAEALAILSALGFCMSDWQCIKRMGGALELLNSELMHGLVNKKIKEHFYLEKTLPKARDFFDALYEKSGGLITPVDKSHEKLFRFSQAPLCFYGFNHHLIQRNQTQIAIVGSRKAAEQALGFAKKLAARLAATNMVVVSGGALGIDQAAHEGALESGGLSILVSGESLNLQAGFVRERLVLIFPYGPFIPQGKFMFVERNRFVASLSDALVVVQGSAGSGTLHTAAFAKKLAKAVFAVPGAFYDPLAYVPNFLLDQGDAKALVDVERFLAIFDKNSAKKPKTSSAKPAKAELFGLLKLIQEHENALSFDELLMLSGQTLADLQKELLAYELEGRLIKRGAQFVLTGN